MSPTPLRYERLIEALAVVWLPLLRLLVLGPQAVYDWLAEMTPMTKSSSTASGRQSTRR